MEERGSQDAYRIESDISFHGWCLLSLGTDESSTRGSPRGSGGTTPASHHPHGLDRRRHPLMMLIRPPSGSCATARSESRCAALLKLTGGNSATPLLALP